MAIDKEYPLARAHAGAHDALHQSLAHSHDALDQIRKLENELRVRKSVLRQVLANDLSQRAEELKLAGTQDVSKLVDEIIG
jgi:hypothetical protein